MMTALDSSLAALEDSQDYPVTTSEVMEALDAAVQFQQDYTWGEPVHDDVVLEWLHHNRGYVNTEADFFSLVRYLEQQHGINRD